MNRPTALAIVWTCLILILCWLPPRNLPLSEAAPSLLKTLHADKIIHAGVFAVFAYVWRRASPRRCTAVAVGIAGAALAVLTEVGQGTRLVGRDADVFDGLADFAGVLLGLILFGLVTRRGARAFAST